jgi:hypothetical protein
VVWRNPFVWTPGSHFALFSLPRFHPITPSFIFFDKISYCS